MRALADLLKELPPDALEEVRDFAAFLLAKQERKAGHLLRQDWAGALRDYRGQYTSVELQHKALGWRGD
ncbi:MAG TPA: DUF2281 domain-containing protein [Anaerolineae bacterium]|nr:DUF2281 domain-containing protein [Anaerolineae bacterium]